MPPDTNSFTKSLLLNIIRPRSGAYIFKCFLVLFKQPINTPSLSRSTSLLQRLSLYNVLGLIYPYTLLPYIRMFAMLGSFPVYASSGDVILLSIIRPLSYRFLRQDSTSATSSQNSSSRFQSFSITLILSFIVQILFSITLF